MPRAFDKRKQSVSDHDPLRGLLDYESVNNTANKAGFDIRTVLEGMLGLLGLGGIAQFFSSLLGGTLNPAVVWEGIANLFLKPLQFFAELIGGFISAFQIPILDPTKILNLPALFTDFQATLNGMWSGLTNQAPDANKVIDDVEDALRNIPVVNVLGVGAANMLDTFQNLFNNFWSGLSGTTGTGKSVADVANAATNVATTADTAMQLGEWTNAVQGLRNNKSLFEGVDETEEANYLIPDAWKGTSSDPVTTIAATAASVPVAYWRAKEVAKKGFISWFGKDFVDVDELRVDIYRANYAASRWDHIGTSPDLIGMVTATWEYLIYNIAAVIDRIDVVSGDVIGVAWRVVGTGTHNIAGMTLGGLPEHPTIHPLRPGSTRTWFGNLNFASTAYTTDIPWFGIGIVEGDVPPPYNAPRYTSYTAAGTYVYAIPSWATHIDGVYVGAGGGGCGGHPISTQHGDGGGAGQWEAETLVRGVDFPVDATELTIVVGDRGDGGPGNTPGDAGGFTRRNDITSGQAAVTAAGGSGGVGQQFGGGAGDSAGDFSYNGTTYVGGGGGTSVAAHNGYPGGAPGGGGGGGAGGSWGVSWPGGGGGHGGAWMTARQA